MAGGQAQPCRGDEAGVEVKGMNRLKAVPDFRGRLYWWWILNLLPVWINGMHPAHSTPLLFTRLISLFVHTNCVPSGPPKTAM